MSISKMDWSRRNANEAVTHPNNQQYLPQSTSSTVQTMPSHKALVPPNSYSTAQTFSTNSASHNLILKSLLGANSIDEIAKIQLSALAKAAPQQSSQISPGQYNPSCSSQQTMTTATNQQSSCNVLNPVVANYQMQIYPNSVLQNFQLVQQLQPMSIIQQQTQPLQILHQVLPTIQQQAQPMQQARPMPIAQKQTQPMPIVQQQMQQQSMPNVQQQMQQQQSMPNVQQQMLQQQSMPNVQQQMQQQSMPNVQQQMQQQSMPNVQQQMQQQSMPNVQQQMQQQSMPNVQQQMQQQQSMPSVQQQPMPSVQQQAQPAQCYGVRYNTREVQQAPQTTQSGGYLHNNAYKEMAKTYGGKRYRKNVQISYQSMPQTNDQLIYSSPNGNSVQYIATYKAGHDKNVPVSTSNYQNGQNISVATSNFHNGQPIQTQMGSNIQQNTLQPQRDTNDYVQSPQRQMVQSLHSGFANNSSNVLPSATVGQMPPLYSQTNTNASNVYNVSINQRLSHTNQNVQPSVQSHTAPQEPHSVTEPPPANVGNVPQDPRANVQNILALLKVYRNVKLKYLMLNRENNLLRQQMLGPSQDNSGAVKPPLISILSDSTVPSNNPIGGKDVSLNSTVQSSPPPYTQRVQTPTQYNDPLNVPVQNVSQSSNSFPGHGSSTNTDLLNQRNYTSPINLGSNANSSGQTIGSGTLRDSMGSIQANNQCLPQDGLHLTSSQSHAQTTSASKSSNSVHITNASNIYSNKPLTFSSREAIKALLPLWKSVTQSEYLEPKQPVVDSRNTIHILEESASNTTNEPSSVTLTQKSEHSGPNVSKGIEPQIAIVSPLVQIKGLANEIRKLSKVVPHSEDIANSGTGGLKENDHFNKILLSLESEDAQLRSSMFFSSPCTVEGLPNCNEDKTSAKNIDTVDEDFQISGVCTLVEGNSSYDSSIAMMFEGSVQPQAGSPMTQTDLNDEHALQCSQGEEVNICDASQATSSFSPTTEVMAVKSEPEEEIEPCVNIEDDQQGENVCLQTQPDNNLPASHLFDLESDTVSDQLSELLTEFPFGIKNYMSDDKDTEVSLGEFTVKTEIQKKSVPFSCDDESESIEDMQIERSMDTLTKEIESTRTEDTYQQCVVERVPTPEVPTDEGNSTQLEDDCFEICESPDDNIHITLLDQDQMNKLFPDESTEPIVNSEESLVECSAKDSEGPVGDDAVNAIKEKSHNETLSVPDKELFCCLFSWIAYTNGNAPKCNCKLTDLTVTKDLTPRFSLPAAMIKTEPSESYQEPLAQNLKSPTVGLNPSLSDPCETKLDKIESTEILPPVLKRPKLEPIECALESKTDQLIGNCSPREGIQAKEDLPEKHREDQSRKDQRTNYTLTNEKVLQPKSPLVDPDRMKSKDPFLHSESKYDDPPKVEKLIIKTDFLKNKHSLKTKKEKKKRKYKERKISRDEEGGSRNIPKTYKNTEMVESAKTYNIDQRVKFGNEKISPAGTVQHPERGIDKLKLSSRSDKSHSRSQAPSLDKRRGRRKSLPESHFEKVKNVPTVQEYLERKRELCNRRPGPKVDQKDELPEIRHRVVEKPTMETHNLLLKLLTNQAKSSSLPKKHSSHEKGSLANKGFDQKSTSYKDKIYLSPCDVSRQDSYEGLHLTKLQIRCSPEKPRYDERRKSPESPVQNKEAPKMLEFKLCPEFDNRSPTTQERKGETKAVKEKSVVEGIKSKKEAWCSGGPGRKSWIDSSSEDQGRHSPSQSSSVKSSSSRPVQDSKATFNAFKQRFYEQRSKSLDNSL